MTRPREARAHRSIAGHSLVESALAMVVLGFGVMLLGAFESSGEAIQENRQRYQMAVGIAEENTRVVEGLPHARLVVTEAFEPPPWLAEPGADRAEWVVPPSDGAESEQAEAVRYAVSWRVVSVDGSLFLRHVDVRVEWLDAGRRRRHYTLRTVRAV